MKRSTSKKRKSKINWDFKDANTVSHTHGFHTYPAKMIPQVAKTLISEYGGKSKLLFDPFCGTGTSLVEANLKGINAIGSDLNPLARLLAKVKTTVIETQTLEFYLHDFYTFLFQYRYGIAREGSIVSPPNFSRIDFWFSKPVKEKLAIIQSYINKIENVAVANFFKVAFSQTIRECSWTRNNEFKLYKMSAEQIRSFKPDVFGTFESLLGKNFSGLQDYILSKRNRAKAEVLDCNSVYQFPTDKIKPRSIDIVVTSPPYGDSSTTVAYGQFSALANQWLGYMENGRSLDGQLMGGKAASEITTFKSEALNESIKKINRRDSGRALDVVSFYSDYNRSIENISYTVKPKGFVCYVVSNRMVKGVQLPTDLITRDFFKQQGFNHIGTFNREISSKRMPRTNSSVGKRGKTGTLMNTESIVVMQKR